jgi:NAD-dependent DNA ligase
MSESPARRVSTDNRLLKRSCESLLGICSGLIADGDLNDKEILFLSTWLTENQEVSHGWPGEVVFRRVREVLADGVISPDERDYLVRTLEQLSGGSFADSGAIASEANKLPVDPNAQIVVEGRSFCFTGQFLFGTRSACERAIINRGGLVSANISRKTDYLVIGELASKEWKHSTHGLKIEQAVAVQVQGSRIAIVDEANWASVLS